MCCFYFLHIVVNKVKYSNSINLSIIAYPLKLHKKINSLQKIYFEWAGVIYLLKKINFNSVMGGMHILLQIS